MKSDATIHLASRGMSGLGAVICSWEDEGGVTFSDLTLSNSWATKTIIFWIFRAWRKKRSFGKNSLATSTILLMAFGSLGINLQGPSRYPNRCPTDTQLISRHAESNQLTCTLPWNCQNVLCVLHYYTSAEKLRLSGRSCQSVLCILHLY